MLSVVCLTMALTGAAPQSKPPRVSLPPKSFYENVAARDRDPAKAFYRKYIDVKGLPVVAAAVVDDRALQRTYEIVTRLLAGRPDVLAAMAKQGMYLIVIGKDQVYTDMPEYRNSPDPVYMNERVRGTGGLPTSFGEENLLSLPLDRYDDESIGVHEFCHTVDSAMARVDPGWSAKRNAAYRAAMSKGLWKDTYAASNPAEFWAEAAQSYFDCNRVNNWNHGPVGTREQLKAYDPATYELVRTAFNLRVDQDWRYRPLRALPNVTPPPQRFRLPAFYTKFTWAREFPVVGRGASDGTLLKANDTIRKMFAYRHDILKALINDGAKLVVLGRNENLSDVPETAGEGAADLLLRDHDYDACKTMVVDEANVLGDRTAPLVGADQTVAVFARALYRVCAKRPVDPNWNDRGRSVQQYELRVKRLDTDFDARLGAAHDGALAKSAWKGTPAGTDREEYWVAGVLAYFEAGGQTHAPSGSTRPVVTREALEAYDPALFALVSETFAYSGKVDWRLPRK